MADTPPITRTSSPMPYIWAGLMMILIGAVFILTILFLRPDMDPLILIPVVAGLASTLFTGIAAFMKSQETHLTVNSQLTAWKQEFMEMALSKAATAHATGMIEGADKEQARIAEQKRIAAVVASVPAGQARVAEPIAAEPPSAIKAENVQVEGVNVAVKEKEK